MGLSFQILEDFRGQFSKVWKNDFAVNDSAVLSFCILVANVVTWRSRYSWAEGMDQFGGDEDVPLFERLSLHLGFQHLRNNP